jgi:multiple sugar transport system permease protein
MQQTVHTNPVPLKIITFIYFLAGVYCIISGLEFLYTKIATYAACNALIAIFIISGLLLLAIARGLVKRESWARSYSILTLLLVIVYLLLSIYTALNLLHVFLVCVALVAIVLLRKKTVTTLFKNPAPALVKNTAIYSVLIVFGVSMLLPFLWMLSSSIKDPVDIFKTPPTWIPYRHYIEIDHKNYEVSITEELVDIRHYDTTGKEQHSTVNKQELGNRLQQGWSLPWKLNKYEYTLNNQPVSIVNHKKKVLLLAPVATIERELIVKPSRIFSKIKLRAKNYPEAYKAIKIGLLYWNSIKIGLLVTLGQVITSSLAAFAFSRLYFPGRDKLFLSYLCTMMVPAAVTMIPVFIICRKLNIVNTHAAVILPGIFSAYGTFMLRQFFMSIPKDLEAAAMIDGCSLFGIYWRIILPLSKPALATLATFTFMGNWRAFLWPLVVLNSADKMTLPVGLQQFMGVHDTQWHLLMAGSVMALLPLILLFLFSQRFFVKGIQLGAIKG